MRKRSAIVVGAAVAGVLALGAQTATAAPNVCVNISGTERVSKGSASCNAVSATDTSSAIAVGANSFANASGGDNNTATASGAGSSAVAGSANGSTARASGPDSSASATFATTGNT